MFRNSVRGIDEMSLSSFENRSTELSLIHSLHLGLQQPSFSELDTAIAQCRSSLGLPSSQSDTYVLLRSIPQSSQSLVRQFRQDPLSLLFSILATSHIALHRFSGILRVPFDRFRRVRVKSRSVRSPWEVMRMVMIGQVGEVRYETSGGFEE